MSPDGKRLATSAGAYNGNSKKPRPVYLWDLSTGKEILIVIGQSGNIYNVTFSLQGSRMASGGADGTIRVSGHGRERSKILKRPGHDGLRAVFDLEQPGLDGASNRHARFL